MALDEAVTRVPEIVSRYAGTTQGILQLVALMLEGNDEINWVAGYSALETVKHDLDRRHLDGQALGWWTDTERKNSTPLRTASRSLVSAHATASLSA